nr:PREDICTED: cytochrome P450 CYP6BK4 isoform X1 [Tribolium castaneum]|eukprot:XP_015839996.1 PREDICTED: cytochrome P450 CYP6BK4 isoform X1 [Tribolium castaneum]
MLITTSLTGDLLAVFLTLVLIIVTYCKWSYQYWERKHLPYLEPQIPFGNVGDSIKEMKHNGWKHGGLYVFTEPNYMVLDLEYVKNIMTKDFQYFVDRSTYYNKKEDPLNAHLLNLGGTKWRNLRTKLTPTFTSGKMKMMFQTLADCQTGLLKRMEKERLTRQPIDIKEVLACFTTEIIGSCAFGLNCKAFEDENSPFRVYGRKVFATSKLQRLKRTIATIFPTLGYLFNISITPKDITNFYLNVVKDTVEYREKNNYNRNDFMQLLIDLKNNKLEGGTSNGGFTLKEVAAQSFVFFLAGFETSSTLMTFALYELARHQEIQDIVREEINEVLRKHNGNVTYDSINDMKYLSQVIDETLRLYPPASLVNRKCIKDYQVPDCDLVIEKGTTVLIPIMGIHYDKDYYPDPEKFDPERFTEENKNARHNYAHIPFGEGPRICIGMRFGLMQTKVGLSCLLKHYKFTVNKRTQEPLKMQPSPLILSAEGEIWLDAEKL